MTNAAYEEVSEGLGGDGDVEHQKVDDAVVGANDVGDDANDGAQLLQMDLLGEEPHGDHADFAEETE